MMIIKKAALLTFLFASITCQSQWQMQREINVSQFKKLPISLNLQFEDNAGVLLFSESGQELVVGLKGKLMSYDIFTERVLWSLADDSFEPNAAVNLFSITPDMFAIANSTYAGGKVVVYKWDGTEATNVTPYGSGRRGVAYAHPDQVVWAGPDASIYGLAILEGELITPETGLKGHATQKFEQDVALKFDPNGLLYSVSPDKQFIRWDQTNGVMMGAKTVLLNAENPLRSMDISPLISGQDGYPALAAIGDNKGLVRIMQLSEGSASMKSTYQVADGYVGNLYFHMSDPNLLIIGSKQSVIFYDFNAKIVRRTINLPAQIRTLSQSTDGTKLAVSLRNGSVEVYSLGRSLVDLRLGDKVKILSIDLKGGAGAQLYKFAGINVGGEATYMGQEPDDEGTIKYKFSAELSSGTTMTSKMNFSDAVRVMVEKIN